MIIIGWNPFNRFTISTPPFSFHSQHCLPRMLYLSDFGRDFFFAPTRIDDFLILFRSSLLFFGTKDRFVDCDSRTWKLYFEQFCLINIRRCALNDFFPLSFEQSSPNSPSVRAVSFSSSDIYDSTKDQHIKWNET